MEYTRETLIKRLGEYVGILPSELHDIACEAVELLERFDCSKGSRLINLDDAIEIISNQQDGSGITYEILSHIIRDILLLPIFETEQPHCGDLNSEWISCSERLPDIDTPVIICTASGGITDGYRWNEKDWFLAWSEYNGWHDGNDGGRITAWMPLPTPYTKGNNK